MRVSGWVAVLRIARREALRSRLRTALVLALVGMPVVALATTAVLYRTWQLTPGQRLDRTMGAADARIQWFGGGAVQQTPNPDDGAVGSDGPTGRAPTPSTSDLAAELPAGTRVVPYVRDARRWQLTTAAGLATASVVGLDYADPVAAGMVTQISGRAPRTAREIAISTVLADDTGLAVGDTTRALAPARTLRVVGTVEQSADRRAGVVFALPAAVHPASSGGFGDGPSWLVDAPQPVTWADVERLNALGYVTLSRAVVLDPPPLSQQPFGSEPDDASTTTIAAAGLITGMIVLEVVLLAGPAFAVGARRRRYELGLLAAVGGSRADLRRVVLADAVVLGGGAGVLGALVGIGVAALAEPVVDHVIADAPGPFAVPWLQLGALVLLGLGAAVLAALVPAIRAARIDVVAALRGLRGVTRSSPTLASIGATLALLGAALTAGAAGSPSTGGVLVGVLLVDVGLIALTPMLIGAVTRAAALLPPSGRIALRDAGRNRGTAASAVAAVMAAVIGATAAGIAATSANSYQRSFYEAQLPQRDLYVPLDAAGRHASAVASVLRSSLPGTPVAVLHGVRDCDPARADMAAPCTDVAVRLPSGSTTQRWLRTALPTTVVDDGAGADAVLGAHVPTAEAALRAGRVVVFDDAGVHDGMITLSATPRPSGATTSVTAPATVVSSGFAGTQLIVPPAVATQLGLPVVAHGVLAVRSSPVSARERQAIAAGLARVAPARQVIVENGYTSPAGWLPAALVGIAALVALLATLIATGLANVDGRPDLVMLAAIGAGPRTRRALPAARAAVIAGLGTVTGVLAGVLPARAYVRAVAEPVVVPWTAIGLALVGIPALAASLAWLCTRGRLPSERAA